MPFPQMLAVRVWSVLLELITRVGDLLVLVWRPRLVPPYLSLWLREALASPYRARRSFDVVRVLHASGQHFRELIYGETPVHTAVWLFKKAGLTSASQLVDLGAGRGRVLLAARWMGAGARGIELLEQHVTLASGLVRRAGAELRQGDATQADLGDATHVFINWTALSPETRERIVERLRTCRPGTRVLTVTRPVEGPGFTLLSRHSLLFTWGVEDVWIHERCAPGDAL
ncbi:putative methyltransferase [Myxococcus stipitatus DSM 14675]|uniref:Putative methyltransferase n=1 Tax=Myxococcus stipitatus (strain DSM 14675 / JCM 12634 / Mx s8) TaxID=1278073 RepID=L7UK36_MYXSD|nr:class I SAM-dependent methyltransferase [Myxococcus stipitatus]AGC49361.1 putative methyltransferase [Myxococcus stipitatus DSM 14675]